MTLKSHSNSQTLPWSLYIDIEGFSPIYQTDSVRALKLLGSLLSDFRQIGTKAYFDKNYELFAYQIGDGLVITPSPLANDSDLIRPVSIAIVLMQLTALRGGTTRAAISFGGISDILGCYPKDIALNVNNGCISLGMGLMTIFQVMGDALINAHKLTIPDSKNPKGPRLLLDINMKVDAKNIMVVDKYNSHIEIDWIRSNPLEVKHILKAIGITQPSSRDIIKALEKYIACSNNLSDEWKSSAKRLIEGAHAKN